MGIKSLILAVGTGLLATAAYLFGGFYGVGADEPHWGVTEGLLNDVREASIARASREVSPPQGLDSDERIRRGAGNYAAMCAACHLAPGRNNSELYAGLYPQPPRFAVAGQVEPQRSFWVVKHGLKMSGMPAWGRSNTDDDIWSLVAFLRAMPGMDAERYQTLVAASDGHTHGGMMADEHGHDMGDEHHQDSGSGHNSEEGDHAGNEPPATAEQPKKQVSDHYADGHTH